jgi:hypothetical protein
MRRTFQLLPEEQDRLIRHRADDDAPRALSRSSPRLSSLASSPASLRG